MGMIPEVFSGQYLGDGVRGDIVLDGQQPVAESLAYRVQRVLGMPPLSYLGESEVRQLAWDVLESRVFERLPCAARDMVLAAESAFDGQFDELSIQQLRDEILAARENGTRRNEIDTLLDRMERMLATRRLIGESVDAAGHEHRGNGEHGGQFAPKEHGDQSPHADIIQRLKDDHGISDEHAEWAAKAISRLEAIFSGPGRAAAVNEVISAAKYSEYLKGILSESRDTDEFNALMEWSIRRGRMWEAE